MSKVEKVTIMMSTTNGIMADIAPRDVTLEGKDTIHVDLGNGKAIEFAANSMIVAMTHLLLGGGEDD